MAIIYDCSFVESVEIIKLLVASPISYDWFI